MKKLKITIITVCYNSSKTIADTIFSIASQSYAQVEHIVVDGASIDNTMEIVKASKSVTKFVTEKDTGIYDAMNKGIAMATGDIIGFLNADDIYVDRDVLSKVANAFENDLIHGCYADLLYVDPLNTNKVTRYWKSRKYKEGLFKSGWMPAHPTFFARKTVYNQFGFFNLNFKIAADFEIMFRFIEQHKINTVYIPNVFVKMRTGGTTNKNIKNVLCQNEEIIRIIRDKYPEFSVLSFFFTKLFNRFTQILTRPSLL